MEELLGELNNLCEKLAEAYNQHAKELDSLRAQKLAEKEHIQNTPLRNASRAEKQVEVDSKATNWLHMLPPGTMDSLDDVLGHEQVTRHNTNEMPSTALMETFGKGNTFSLRSSYIKTEAELAHLSAVAKAAALENRIKERTSKKRVTRRSSLARQISLPRAAYNNLSDLVRNPVSSLTKRNWDMLGCFLLAYDVFVIPLGVFDLPTHPLLVFFEVVSVIYWTSDIGMTMTTGYYENLDDEEPVMEFSSVLRHYVFSKNFPFDLTLAVVDWIITSITLRSIATDADNLSAAGLARLVRAGRVLRLLKLMRISKASGFMDNLRRWFTFRCTFKVDRELLLLMIDLMKILGVGILAFHYMVCIYYSVGDMTGSWISRHPSITDESFVSKYIITGELMSRRGSSISRHLEKDVLTDGEKFFDALAWVVSTGFVTWLTSTVTSSMLEVAQRQRERNDKMYYIRNHYLVHHQIDPHIRMQLLKFMGKGYAEYREAQQRQRNEAELLESLPVQLAKDFRREAWKPVLIEHPFFKLSNCNLMEDICLNAVSEIFCRKREIVFKKSGICSRMLFVFKGQYAYVRFGQRADSMLFDSSDRRVSKGAWLSEPVLWTASWHHRGSLLSIDSGFFCAVLPDALENLMKHHEPALHSVVRYAVEFVDSLNVESIWRPQSLSDLSTIVMEKALTSLDRRVQDSVHSRLVW